MNGSGEFRLRSLGWIFHLCFAEILHFYLALLFEVMNFCIRAFNIILMIGSLMLEL